MTETVPLALQVAVRVEKTATPGTSEVCAAVALATIALLDDPRSAPGGPWHAEVAAWNGDRIRKIVRRGRGAAWQRAQEPRGVTVHVDGVSARAYVPGPVDEVPDPVARLQIQSTPLDPPSPATTAPPFAGLTVAVTPDVDMSWGKQAAQCAHATQRAWLTAPADDRLRWDRAGRPIRILHPTPGLWAEALGTAEVRIHDGGYTEIPAGTLTTVAWWGDRSTASTGGTMTRHEIRLGGPNEERMGLSRAVRVGDHIVVGGTAAINEDGTNVAADDVEGQARRIWQIIEAALTRAGAGLGDIVRTRTMLVDASDHAVVTRVRREVLAPTMPAETIVEVDGFVDPDWRLEIEVDAMVTDR